jgi:hypothetical protein
MSPQFAAVFVIGALAGCASVRAVKPVPSNRSPLAACPPLTVMADGLKIAGVIPSAIVGEKVTGTDGITHLAYRVELRTSPLECAAELLDGEWSDTDLQITVLLSPTGEPEALVGLEQTNVRGRVLVPSTRAGETVELCIDEVGPVRAGRGALAGKQVTIRGKVRATYCGTRGELRARHPEDRG